MDNLNKFVEDGISFYQTYLEITNKQLEDKDNLSDEDFTQLIYAEAYYSGRLDSFNDIKNYQKVLESAQTNNSEHI